MEEFLIFLDYDDSQVPIGTISLNEEAIRTLTELYHVIGPKVLVSENGRKLLGFGMFPSEKIQTEERR